MYTGNVIMMIGIPLALGSYWGLIFVVPGVSVLAWRIRDEEKLLRNELDGYSEYTAEGSLSPRARLCGDSPRYRSVALTDR